MTKQAYCRTKNSGSAQVTIANVQNGAAIVTSVQSQRSMVDNLRRRQISTARRAQQAQQTMLSISAAVWKSGTPSLRMNASNRGYSGPYCACELNMRSPAIARFAI